MPATVAVVCMVSVSLFIAMRTYNSVKVRMVYIIFVLFTQFFTCLFVNFNTNYTCRYRNNTITYNHKNHIEKLTQCRCRNHITIAYGSKGNYGVKYTFRYARKPVFRSFYVIHQRSYKYGNDHYCVKKNHNL